MDCPYRGLVPYSEDPEDVRLFFGRDVEQRVLMDNIMAVRLSVVYGESGVGKSSILNAGLAPKLRAAPDLLLIIFRSWYANPLEGLIRSVREVAGEHAIDIPAGNLTEALIRLAESSKKRVLVILDQFEEYFQYGDRHSGPSSFAAQFPAAVRESHLDANFMISIRSDSLASLDFFKGQLPTMLRNRIPLRNLTAEGAKEAIERPLEQYNKGLPESAQVTLETSSKLADEIIEEIGRKLEQTPDPNVREVPAAYLQVVMTKLWDRERELKGNILRVATLDALGGAARIYEQYFGSILDKKLDKRERRLAGILFSHLVTPTGRKVMSSDKELVSYPDVKRRVKLAQTVLQKLEEARILATVPPPAEALPPDGGVSEIYFQFAHDVLARAARQWSRAQDAQAGAYKRAALRTAAVALLGMLCLSVIQIAIFSVRNSIDVPRIDRPKEVAFLPQNWAPEQRQLYYHTPLGSELVPYKWFLALEQPSFSITGAPLLRDDAYLQGFGFIPDPASEQNPDALPVGFARDDRFVDPYTGQKPVVLGLTCAACHTGELFYGGKAIRIDAGPSMIDLQKFTEAVGLALTWTYYDPARFNRFAKRVLVPGLSSEDESLLRQTLKASLKTYLDRIFEEFQENRHLFPTPEGYGRNDELARIGNFVFGTELNSHKNLAVGDGPANYPPLWDTPWMDWQGYNLSSQQPVVRGLLEGLATGARINLLGYSGVMYRNTVRVDDVRKIYSALGGSAPGQGVWSPSWPQDILGKIDVHKAARGEKLYNELCLHCHQSPMLSDEGRKGQHWTNSTSAAESQFFRVTEIPLAEIGTDPKEAENFNNRTADSGPLGRGIVSARDGLRYVSQQILDQAYSDLKLTPEEVRLWNGHLQNEIRSPLAYKARPLNGIWATPPYLHNGSVPNLFALLSPVAERPRVFYLGNKEYDPVKLGLNTNPLRGASELRTDLPGNSNAGHEFNDSPTGNGVIGRQLSEEERLEIIEYLKTI